MVLTIIIVLILSIIYYLSLPTTFPNILNEPQTQGNETQENRSPFRFPFIFPWQTVSSGTGGGSGGSSPNQTTQPSNYTQKQKYTLSVSSFPEGFRISAGYYIDDIKSFSTFDVPYDLQVDANSNACVIPTYITTGIIKWALDGNDCQFSTCEESTFGCLIFMNTNHLATLYYTRT